MAAQLHSKLGMKQVFGKVKQDDIPSEGINQIVRIAGHVTGLKTGMTSFGETFGFTGRFRAITLATGEVHEAATCYLPQIATDYMRPATEQAVKDGGAVEFLFDIGIKLNRVSEEGIKDYMYTVTPVIEQKMADDPLDALMNVAPLPVMLENKEQPEKKSGKVKETAEA